MTTVEMTSRSGEDLSPAQAVKQALAGFMGDLGTFQSDIQTKLEKQEEKLTMLQAKWEKAQTFEDLEEELEEADGRLEELQKLRDEQATTIKNLEASKNGAL